MNPSEDFFISLEETNLRLDKLLADKFKPHFSRTYFANLIEDGLVLLNGKPAKKRFTGEEGDQVEIFFRMEEPTDLTPENIPLDVVFEDEYMVVVNKPVGMVVHPAVGHWSGTFVNALLYHCHIENDGSLRPGIVHRLDKDTSGLLIGAKTAQAQKRLMELFSSRSIYKEYRANTFGAPQVGKIETLIGRNPKNRQEMAVVLENGKRAVTDIEVLQKEGDFAYVKCVIETGRTHQIRVHLKHLKTPVLGDPIYGADKVNQKYKLTRTLLHAYRLTFTHPFTDKIIDLTAPIPSDFILK